MLTGVSITPSLCPHWDEVEDGNYLSQLLLCVVILLNLHVDFQENLMNRILEMLETNISIETTMVPLELLGVLSVGVKYRLVICSLTLWCYCFNYLETFF